MSGPLLARVCLLLGLLLALHAVPVRAQEWGELTQTEQAILAPWAGQWSSLDADRRQRLVEGARRWQSMSGPERDRVRDRLERWQALSPEERERVRRRIERFEAMPQAQQRRVRQGLERMQALPPAERERMRRRWQSFSPEQREAFLDGMATGARAERWRWLVRLEPEERDRFRVLVRGLDLERRSALGHRMRGLDEAGKVEFARSLIEADPAQRDALIGAPALRDPPNRP